MFIRESLVAVMSFLYWACVSSRAYRAVLWTVERRCVDLAQRQECAVGMFCHLSFCHGKAGVVGAAARGHCEERSKEQY